MALNIEFTTELTTGSMPFISHEKDSSLYNYYIYNEASLDSRLSVDNSDYSTVEIGEAARHLTTKAVRRIGIKNFPGIGAIGFYRDAYSDDCRIVAPIHVTNKYYKAPTLNTAEIVDGKLHIVVTPPNDISYTCYRIVARQGAFAFEYIAYKTDYLVDVPPVKGDYTVYCIGYDEDNGTISHNSNELSLSVLSGANDWSPSYEAIDDIDDAMDDLTKRIKALEAAMGDIGGVLDNINGIEV